MFEEVEGDDEEGENEVEGMPGSPKESLSKQVLAASTTISDGSAPSVETADSAETRGVGKAAETKERLLTLAKVKITMSLSRV